jgi:membrane-associated phospholipid phosphatase
MTGRQRSRRPTARRDRGPSRTADPRVDAFAVFARRLGPVAEAVLVAAAFVLYMVVRGVTQHGHDRAVANAHAILRAERAFRIAPEAAIQEWVLERSFWLTFFNAVYVWLFWPTVLVALVYLYRRHRAEFVRFRNALFLSGLAGLAVFASYPVAPPRFLEGFTDTVDELTRAHFVAHPSGLTNQYAAMPSFHVGWTVLASFVLVRTLHRPAARMVSALPPLLMSVAVMATGNHFLLDLLVGTALGLASWWIVGGLTRPADRARPRVEGDRDRRRARGPASPRWSAAASNEPASFVASDRSRGRGGTPRTSPPRGRGGTPRTSPPRGRPGSGFEAEHG